MPAKVEMAIEELGDKLVAGYYAEGDTNGAPTAAELVTAFGPAVQRTGKFKATFKDTHTGGKTYLILCDGTAYSIIEATAAV